MEYLYALYLLSGFIKSFLIFWHLNLKIDLTLIFAIFLTLGMIIHIWGSKFYNLSLKRMFSFEALILFYSWMIFSLIYGISPEYCYIKTFLFLTNILAFMIPLFYKGFNIEKFLKFFVILETIIGLIFLYYFPKIYFLPSSETLKFFEGIYLGSSEISGLCLIILFCKRLYKKSFHFLLIILNFAILVLAGGRGPLIFTLLVLLFLYIFLFVKSLKKGKVKKYLVYNILLGCSLIISIFIIIYILFPKTHFLLERSLSRMSYIIEFIKGSTNYDYSIEARVYHLRFSINQIMQNTTSFLFGYGIGSYGMLYSGYDGRGYPHNIILEVWVELGLIGVILFIFFLLSTFKNNIRFENPFFWVILFLFFNALKSSSLVDLRIMFGFLAIFIIYGDYLNYQKMLKYRFGGNSG